MLGDKRKETLSNQVLMQRDNPTHACLHRPSFGPDSDDFHAFLFKNINTAQLHNLTNTRACVSAQPRHPSARSIACGGGVGNGERCPQNGFHFVGVEGFVWS